MADPGLLQLQMKRNTEDLQDYLRDLGNWEDEIKKKDAMLHKQKPVLKKKLPPVRNELSSDKQKRKSRRKAVAQSKKPEEQSKSGRIKSFDYSAWDNFDVDTACAKVDHNAGSSSSSELSEEEDEEVEQERRKQLAVLEKEKGNSLFKEGKHEAAVERYTRGVDLDPSNAVLPANRAMALLKLKRYAAAEQDCSLALSLDSSYIKAWLRRATARALLNKLQPAIDDYHRVLELDKNNKQAKTEIERLELKLKAQQEQEKKENHREAIQQQAIPSGPYVHAVKRPQHLRSKKPMRRILIEEVGEKRDQDDRNGTPSNGAMELVDTTGSGHVISDKSGAEVQESETGPASSETGPASSETGPASSETGTASSETEPSSSETGPSSSETGPASSEAGTASSETDLVVPPVAINSIELQSHWKRLRRNKQCLAQYFQAIPTSRYPVLLQQSLETDIFSDILSILEHSYVLSGRSCLEELTWLTKVKRFEMAVMFLNKSDRQALVRIFSGLKQSLGSEHHQELSALAKKYSTNL